MRCNRHHAQGNERCTHKINVPFPGKAFKAATDSIEAIKVDSLAIPFCWTKMDFSKETVSIVAYLTVMHAIPAPQVVQIMRQLFKKPP